MEKYQMFFPCSSSSNMAAVNLSSSSSADHMIPISSTNQSSNGGLGLLRPVVTDQNHAGRGQVVDNNKAHRHHHHQYQFGGETSSSTVGHHEEYNSSSSAAGKSHVFKGEKKTRKPKHAFQTRSQVDILDDGYRWRKYGQKAVKNNKFPRSYYRCTYQGCNVKKQVQRLTKDEGIVVTTYEGIHTHTIDKPSDNFDHILTQMQIYTPF